jgi:hypothetical protein
MTTIEYSEVLNTVAAPTGVPYRFGLFSVVDFDQLGDHDRAGMQWLSDSCAGANITLDPCKTGDDESIDPGICSYVGIASPFTAYVHNVDSIAGKSLDVHESSSRQRFIMAEQTAVEAHVFSLLNQVVADDVSALDAASMADQYANALASVEDSVPAITGAEGMIYVSRFGASLLASQLDKTSGMLRTKLGTPVAAMGGWESGVHKVFGTGPVKAARGDIEVYNGTAGADLASNDVSIIAERAYAFGWDCGVVGAQLTL